MIEQLLQADRELNVDRVDRAEAIYRSVSTADPSNAIAVTGLARCALARGDDRGAHELASRALSIDPEDDMARRMEARLAEILTLLKVFECLLRRRCQGKLRRRYRSCGGVGRNDLLARSARGGAKQEQSYRKGAAQALSN